MHSKRETPVSPRWYRGAPPKSTGMFLGAIGAVGFILPFIGATLLEPSVGDGWTITILSVLTGVCMLVAVVLFMRGRWVEALLLLPLAVGLGIAIHITATMEWR